MKFPYGISDFKAINTEDYFYCDRTDKIKLLENIKYQLFIRPRRFGKSLVLSMLENYYDVAKKDEFQSIFGKLKIGKNPTSLYNSYYILKFDFSCVDPTGTVQDVKDALFDHINDCIKRFILCYGKFNLPDIEINRNNAISTLQSLVNSVSMTDYPVYLLTVKSRCKIMAKKLEQRYCNLRLQKFVVAALGFERICFKKID